jgi:site-specific DNA-methyltransferase (adenine-specific)
MKDLKDNEFDFCLTSPPYNIGGKYDNYNDSMPEEGYDRFIHNVVVQLLRTCKLTAFNIQYTSSNMRTVFSLIGDYQKHIKDILIWHKAQAQPAPHTLRNNFEFIIMFEKNTRGRHYDIDLGNATTCFLEENNSTSNRESFNTEEHQAIMPIQLARRIITTFTKQGDNVFDPFTGTGTTGIACIQNNRNFTGTEISNKYTELARKRIELYILQTSKFLK